jgi:hypothetical protein
MKLVREINMLTDEFIFHLYVPNIVARFYRSHNRFRQIPVVWILLRKM